MSATATASCEEPEPGSSYGVGAATCTMAACWGLPKAAEVKAELPGVVGSTVCAAAVAGSSRAPPASVRAPLQATTVRRSRTQAVTR
ncbi:hypothetical protein ACFQ0T_23335 [Kitasatospora gansuensis]